MPLMSCSCGHQAEYPAQFGSARVHCPACQGGILQVQGTATPAEPIEKQAAPRLRGLAVAAVGISLAGWMFLKGLENDRIMSANQGTVPHETTLPAVPPNGYRSDNPFAASKPVASVPRYDPDYCESARGALGERPSSGAELLSAGRYRSGLGEMRVTNDGSDDAIVGIAPVGVWRIVRAIYVRGGERALMTRIPEGTYQIRFATGAGWVPTSKTFCLLKSATEFEGVDTFKEVESYDGVTYTVLEIGLTAVIGGTASTRPISPTAMVLAE